MEGFANENRLISDLLEEIRAEIFDYCQNHHSQPLEHAIFLILKERTKLKKLANLNGKIP